MFHGYSLILLDVMEVVFTTYYIYGCLSVVSVVCFQVVVSATS